MVSPLVGLSWRHCQHMASGVLGAQPGVSLDVYDWNGGYRWVLWTTHKVASVDSFLSCTNMTQGFVE